MFLGVRGACVTLQVLVQDVKLDFGFGPQSFFSVTGLPQTIPEKHFFVTGELVPKKVKLCHDTPVQAFRGSGV